jgi:hypothetical protein
MAFRVASIARSFDIEHLAFFFTPHRNIEMPLGSPASLVCFSGEITPLYRRD